MAEKKAELKDVEIRDLRNGDVWQLADILIAVSERSDMNIVDMIKDLSREGKEGKKKEEEEVGIEMMVFVLKGAFVHARDELMDWFSDLCEMDKEEFLQETKFTAMLDIIEQLKEQEDVEDFFSKVSSLFSELRK